LVARCLLAAIFLVAAVGKLLDAQGARTALEEFGVPARAIRPAGLALPLAEIVVAGALLVRPSAVPGAAGALILLLIFTGGVARAISQGRAPDCHCFGQIHSQPAGPLTLIRNIVLCIPAVLVLLAGSGPSLDGALGALHGAQIALVATAILAALLALAVAQLWGDVRRLKLELTRATAGRARPGLPRGAPAPEFSLTAARGDAASLSALRELARPLVLVFLSTHCGPCLTLLPQLAGWQTALADSVTVAAIFSGDAGEIERLSDEHGLGLALAQQADETFLEYGLRATPSAVVVDAEGLVASAPAEGASPIEALIRATAAPAAARPAQFGVQTPA
jgi:thiol-disulfide isomerase/thioredoxin/uncharacterized membrane protein YphA (DoxX/SURF4 family)